MCLAFDIVKSLAKRERSSVGYSGSNASSGRSNAGAVRWAR